jgi:hypothetical protein
MIEEKGRVCLECKGSGAWNDPRKGPGPCPLPAHRYCLTPRLQWNPMHGISGEAIYVDEQNSSARSPRRRLVAPASSRQARQRVMNQARDARIRLAGRRSRPSQPQGIGGLGERVFIEDRVLNSAPREFRIYLLSTILGYSGVHGDST